MSVHQNCFHQHYLMKKDEKSDQGWLTLLGFKTPHIKEVPSWSPSHYQVCPGKLKNVFQTKKSHHVLNAHCFREKTTHSTSSLTLPGRGFAGSASDLKTPKSRAFAVKTSWSSFLQIIFSAQDVLFWSHMYLQPQKLKVWNSWFGITLGCSELKTSNQIAWRS